MALLIPALVVALGLVEEGTNITTAPIIDSTAKTLSDEGSVELVQMQQTLTLLLNSTSDTQHDALEGLRNSAIHLNDLLVKASQAASKAEYSNTVLGETLRALRESDEKLGSPGNTKVDYESGDLESDNGTLVESHHDGIVVVGDNDPALLHEDLVFLSDLVAVLAACALFGGLAASLRLPMVVGFIFGGVVVGPSCLGLVADMKRIDTLAEVGAALILFSQGLEFDMSEMTQFHRLSLSCCVLQLFNGFSFVTLAPLFFSISLSPKESFVMGLAVALSSSTVAAHLTTDYGLTHTTFSRILHSMLVGQDLMMGLLLCLPEAIRNGYIGVFIVLRQVFIGGSLVYISVKLSAWILPRFAHHFLRKDIPQLYLLSCMTMCIGSAWLSSMLGLSSEFGAFFGGLTLSRATSLNKDKFSQIVSVRYLFGAVLFSSFGMLISPLFLWNHKSSIVSGFLLVFGIKFCSNFVLLRSFKQSFQVATLVSINMAQIAEFSMLLAGKAYVFGVLNRQNYLIILTIAVISLFTNPLLFKWAMSISSLRYQRHSKVISVATHPDHI